MTNLNNPDVKYIYESPDNGRTVYRREFGKSKRELIFAKKELGTVADHALVKELCEKYPNYYDLGQAVMKYYLENNLRDE